MDRRLSADGNISIHIGRRRRGSKNIKLPPTWGPESDILPRMLREGGGMGYFWIMKFT